MRSECEEWSVWSEECGVRSVGVSVVCGVRCEECGVWCEE